MGVAMLAMAGVSMYSDLENAQDKAAAQARQGNLAAKNKMEQTKYSAGKAKVDFLSSGIAIEGGSTSGAALMNIYETGEADARAIKSNYESSIDNIMSSGMQQAMMTGVQTGMSMGAGAPSSGAGKGSNSMFNQSKG